MGNIELIEKYKASLKSALDNLEIYETTATISKLKNIYNFLNFNELANLEPNEWSDRLALAIVQTQKDFRNYVKDYLFYGTEFNSMIGNLHGVINYLLLVINKLEKELK